MSAGRSKSTDASFPIRASIFFVLLSTTPGRLVPVTDVGTGDLGDLGGVGEGCCWLVSSDVLIMRLLARFKLDPLLSGTGDLGRFGDLGLSSSSFISELVSL